MFDVAEFERRFAAIGEHPCGKWMCETSDTICAGWWAAYRSLIRLDYELQRNAFAPEASNA